MRKKYALIALVELGANYQRGVIQIGEIARRRAIPEQFLSNILIELKRGGFVGSKKGKNGGYYLVTHPKEISVACVLDFLSEKDEYICCTPAHSKSCIYSLREEDCPVFKAHLEIKKVADQALNNVNLDMLDLNSHCLRE